MQNNQNLHRSHAKAVKTGFIRPKMYKLVRLNYFFADRIVGIMQKSKSFGWGSLYYHLTGKRPSNLS